MQARIGRLWQVRREGKASDDNVGESTDLPVNGTSAAAPDVEHGAVALPDPGQVGSFTPEQPVLLMPSGGTRPVHVGELLPARRRVWPLAVARLPTISKRAILAAGVCAGLAAPALARHLATRIIFGRPVARAEGILEVTRIVYSGPLTPRAAAAIGKILEAGRR